MSHFSLNLPSKWRSLCDGMKMQGKDLLTSPLKVMSLFGALVVAMWAVFWGLKGYLDGVQNRALQLRDWELTASQVAAKRGELTHFDKLYGGADPYYIENVLEKEPFLTPEKEALKSVLEQPIFTGWQAIRNRLNFLESGKNQLKFVERLRRTSPPFSESEAKLLHPVQVDLDDLRRLLLLIEGVPVTDGLKRPALQFKSFDLKRAKAFSTREIYTIDMEIIKKEREKNENK